MVEHPVEVLPAFLQLLCPNILSLGVGLLELLEFQTHSPNADLIRTLIGQFDSERVPELT